MRVQNQASLGAGKSRKGHAGSQARNQAGGHLNMPQMNGRKGDFISTEVDNPYGEKSRSNSKKIAREKVVRRVSDNPLLQLHARGKISQSQFLAGQKYLAAHLICTGQTGQAIDYSRQRVDCSVAPMTISEKQMHASDLIRNANRELRAEGHNEKSPTEAILRIQKITGEGLNVTQYCKAVRGLTSNKSISKQLGFLREDLSVLAKLWGFER